MHILTNTILLYSVTHSLQHANVLEMKKSLNPGKGVNIHIFIHRTLNAGKQNDPEKDPQTHRENLKRAKI